MSSTALHNVGSFERAQRLRAYCDVASHVFGLLPSEEALMRRLLMHSTQPASDRRKSATLLPDLGADRRQSVTRKRGTPSRIAELVEAATALDYEIEYSPFSDAPLSTTLGDLEHHDNPAVRSMLNLLRRTSPRRVCQMVSRLPVFPTVIRELMLEVRQDTVTAARLARIARRDAVLIGSLLAEMATARYTTDAPITDVTQAIAYMGTRRACEVMLATALRPVVCRPALPGLWQHSLEAAHTAARLSAVTGLLRSEDAYLLGLVHDVGRLLLEVSSDALRTRDMLVRGRVPTSVAELLTCGLTHAEAGAEVLRYWQFSDAWVEAVRYHHEPEHSARNEASFLYVLEFWTGPSTVSPEDLPSTARLCAALERLGITQKQLYDSVGEYPDGCLMRHALPL